MNATEELNKHRGREAFQHKMNNTFNTDTNLTTNLCSGDESFAETDPIEKKLSGMNKSQGIKLKISDLSGRGKGL